MTYNEIISIAKKLDTETQQAIDLEVAERLEILKEGELSEEDMEKMEECLYMSLVLQEYLDGEYELLDEERELLLNEMEEMFNEYGDLLIKAKLEEKVSKKKRMALELMKIRKQLMERKERIKDVDQRIKKNKESKKEMESVSSKENMKAIAKQNKKSKRGFDKDSGPVKENNSKEKQRDREMQKLKDEQKRQEYEINKLKNDRKNEVVKKEQVVQDVNGATVGSVVSSIDKTLTSTNAPSDEIRSPFVANMPYDPGLGNKAIENVKNNR